MVGFSRFQKERTTTAAPPPANSNDPAPAAASGDEHMEMDDSSTFGMGNDGNEFLGMMPGEEFGYYENEGEQQGEDGYSVYGGMEIEHGQENDNENDEAPSATGGGGGLLFGREKASVAKNTDMSMEPQESLGPMDDNAASPMAEMDENAPVGDFPAREEVINHEESETLGIDHEKHQDQVHGEVAGRGSFSFQTDDRTNPNTGDESPREAAGMFAQQQPHKSQGSVTGILGPREGKMGTRNRVQFGGIPDGPSPEQPAENQGLKTPNTGPSGTMANGLAHGQQPAKKTDNQIAASNPTTVIGEDQERADPSAGPPRTLQQPSMASATTSRAQQRPQGSMFGARQPGVQGVARSTQGATVPATALQQRPQGPPAGVAGAARSTQGGFLGGRKPNTTPPPSMQQSRRPTVTPQSAHGQQKSPLLFQQQKTPAPSGQPQGGMFKRNGNQQQAPTRFLQNRPQANANTPSFATPNPSGGPFFSSWRSTGTAMRNTFLSTDSATQDKTADHAVKVFDEQYQESRKIHSEFEDLVKISEENKLESHLVVSDCLSDLLTLQAQQQNTLEEMDTLEAALDTLLEQYGYAS